MLNEIVSNPIYRMLSYLDSRLSIVTVNGDEWMEEVEDGVSIWLTVRGCYRDDNHIVHDTNLDYMIGRTTLLDKLDNIVKNPHLSYEKTSKIALNPDSYLRIMNLIVQQVLGLTNPSEYSLIDRSYTSDISGSNLNKLLRSIADSYIHYIEKVIEQKNIKLTQDEINSYKNIFIYITDIKPNNFITEDGKELGVELSIALEYLVNTYITLSEDQLLSLYGDYKTFIAKTIASCLTFNMDIYVNYRDTTGLLDKLDIGTIGSLVTGAGSDELKDVEQFNLMDILLLSIGDSLTEEVCLNIILELDNIKTELSSLMGSEYVYVALHGTIASIKEKSEHNQTNIIVQVDTLPEAYVFPIYSRTFRAHIPNEEVAMMILIELVNHINLYVHTLSASSLLDHFMRRKANDISIDLCNSLIGNIVRDGDINPIIASKCDLLNPATGEYEISLYTI